MSKADTTGKFEQAQEYYKAERFKEALALMDELSVSMTSQQDIMHLRALCLARTGRVEGAEFLCDQLTIVHKDPRGEEIKPLIADAKRESKEAPKEKVKKEKQSFRLPGFVIPTIIGTVLVAAVVGGSLYGLAYVRNRVPEPVPSSPALPDRVVRFATDQSVGTLHSRYWTHDMATPVGGKNEWKGLGEAQGDVSVPGGQELRLVVPQFASRNLAPLSRLKPNDVQSITLEEALVSDSDMTYLKGLTGLRDLNISATDITGTGLKRLRKPTSLRRLSMGPMPDLGEEGRGILLTMTLLDQFQADDSDVTDEWLAVFCDTAKDLVFLSLDDNPQLTDEGIKHIEKLKSLKDLFLSYSSITDEGLARLQTLPALERLWLEGTLVTDEALAGFQSMPSLTNLSVARTRITKAGVEQLKKMRRLQRLEVSACAELAPEDIRALRDALPNCRIITNGNISNRPAIWE